MVVRCLNLVFNASKRILRKAGLSEDLTIHSLRHTYAVIMLEAGADIKFVQEQLGQGSAQITSDVYAHISKKLEKRNIDKYEEYTSRIFGSENQKPRDVGGRNLNRSAIPSKRPPVHSFKTP
ncbi:tyrosine-type recombinase/integrase [Paenibacillus sp. ClWae2A]|uniref:tyrosine-type recombinase/integrase n=1 Tax=Paenibacillus sp. ClWae2A TaxID=3057177 RepID=UPI0028F4E0A9|nr:tyrosine-type recombinase/integrase [Paenibacillus sp. ClWae2A]MDT9718157.1 tyrosine-type recombinase/integrase [Paenibacillus sp. ClWae2A]